MSMDFALARIGQIEAKIAQMSAGAREPQNPAAATAAGSSFAAALARAGSPAVTPPPTTATPAAAAMPFAGGGGGSPAGLKGLPAPPHFLGPAPVVPASTVSAGSGGTAGGGVAAWNGLVEKYAGQFDVPEDLVRAVMDQESGGDSRAVSPAGAQGLMQLMPGTARGLGVTNAFDPEQNVRAGVQLLRDNLNRYNGDVPRALAAYNAGPGAVAKYGGVPPFRETQNYVARITARLNGSENGASAR